MTSSVVQHAEELSVHRRLSTPTLRLEGVSIAFGGNRALNDVSLEVDAGELVGLIGPNGAGKTTIFNIVSGWLVPGSGEVFLEGESLRGVPPYRRAARGLARTYQNVQLFGDLTVRENLLVSAMAALKGQVPFLASVVGLRSRSLREAEERVASVIGLLSLDRLADRLAGALPLGIARIVELGRVLCQRPKLVLLDEPLSGTDAREAEVLMSVVRRAHEEEGFSLLVIEHDVEQVLGLCEHVYVLDFGNLISSGTPAEVSQDPIVIKAYLGEEFG